MSEDIHSLAALYAIDALDDLDRGRFESHLDDCEYCRAEVASFAEAAHDMVGPDVLPRAEVRAHALAMLDDVRQLDATRPDALQRHGGIPTDGSAERRGPSRWMVGAAAVLVLVVALGVVALSLGGDGEGPSDQVATVVDSPDATRFEMVSDDPARAGTELEVIHSASHDATVVVGDHVHTPDSGQVYQLWGVTEAGMVDAGVFEPHDDGTVAVPVGTPQGVQGWAVTVERVGGSPVPSGDPVFVSETV